MPSLDQLVGGMSTPVSRALRRPVEQWLADLSGQLDEDAAGGSH